MSSQYSERAVQSPEKRSRQVRPEVRDLAYRYSGSIGRALFALDGLVFRMYQEQMRQYEAAAAVGQQAVATELLAGVERLRTTARGAGMTVLDDYEVVAMDTVAPLAAVETEVYGPAAVVMEAENYTREAAMDTAVETWQYDAVAEAERIVAEAYAAAQGTTNV